MYRIELREYPLLRFAAHGYWVAYEGDELVGELHGLATCRRTGVARAVGTRRDQLRGWCFPMTGQPLRMQTGHGGFSGLLEPSQASAVVFEGDRDAVMSRWQRAVLAASALDSANVTYSMIGGALDDITTGNSNSAFRTFADVMELPTPKLRAWTRPGERKNVLPRATYAGLYETATS